jgi:spore cortex formation protein SpoVR/YcgB (stage V sporulation)
MACITHYQVMEDLFTLGLMDAEMHGEFRMSHAGVIYQPPGSVVRQHPQTGEDVEIFVGSNINIYSLGFGMMHDIKRICYEPTEEDKEWFPEFAGKGEWIQMMHKVAKSYCDETAVEQFLSPTVMRQFKYFLLEGLPENEELEVTAIHDKDGFQKVRENLARDYRMSDKIPKVTLKDYQQETDRCLVLRHHIVDDQPLARKETEQILELIHAQTKQPVVMESIDKNGVVKATYSSPPDYDYRIHRRYEPHYAYDLG